MSDPIDMEADKTKEKMTMATIIKQTKEEINWAEIATEPENMVRVEVPKLIASTEIMAEDIMERQEETPLLASMGFTMEQANEAARYLAESFRIFCEHLEEATRAVADAWEAIKRPCGGRRRTTGRWPPDTTAPKRSGSVRSTPSGSWPGIGRRSCNAATKNE